MSVRVRSARRFLERAGLRRTDRGPLPALDVAALTVRQLSAPGPGTQPDLRRPALGDPPPDRGASEEWPFPPTDSGAD